MKLHEATALARVREAPRQEMARCGALMVPRALRESETSGGGVAAWKEQDNNSVVVAFIV
ncbi:MAG: hypothetical protein ACR2PG_27820 [Hyphomicrobiaceae bacterium]